MCSQNSNLYIEEIRDRQTPYELTVEGIKLQIIETVFPTGQLGKFFHSVLTNPKTGLNEGDKVLDYGCGCGFLSILAAQQGAEVVALDINPKAVKCASYNIKKHNLDDKVIVIQSRELEELPIDAKFDVVIANLPWENSKPQDALELAFYDEGYKMRKALFAKAKHILTPTGKILFSYGKRMQNSIPIEDLFQGFDYNVIAEQFIHDEPHYIYSIIPNASYDYEISI